MRTPGLFVSLFVASLILGCTEPPSQPSGTGALNPAFGRVANKSGETLGGVDLDKYCQSLGFVRAALTKSRLGPDAAHDNWQCVTASGEMQPFSFEQACRFQYGLKSVQARPTNPDDAFSWVCYAVGNIGSGGAEKLGGVDLDGYCRSLGFARAALTKPRFGPNAARDNWRCATTSGDVHPFSLEQACKFQYRRQAVQAHPTDPDDAFTWVCYSVGNA